MIWDFLRTVLALCCSVRAQDLNCKELTQPLDPSLMKLSGKWILYAASSNNKKFFDMMQKTKSSWMEITSESETIGKVHVEDKWGDQRYMREGKSTLLGKQIKLAWNSTFLSEDFGHYLQILDNDALLWSAETSFFKQNIHKAKILLLPTKNGTLSDPTRERFNKQAACLGFTHFQF